MVLKKKKAAPKKIEENPVIITPEEKLVKEAAKEEAAIANKKTKKPSTDRQKFHKFYREDYMKDVDMEAPHHPDKHGILGYENNVVVKEIWSREEGGYIEQEINGFCGYCSLSQQSAKEAYDSTQK